MTNSNCKACALGCLGSGASLAYRFYNLISGDNPFMTYDPTTGPSEYGATSSIEDFAESFGAYVVEYWGWESIDPISDERLNLISDLVQVASE